MWPILGVTIILMVLIGESMEECSWESPEQATCVNFDASELETLPKSLKNLNIEGRFQELPVGAFQHLPSLEILVLQVPGFEIKSGVFKGLKNLKELTVNTYGGTVKIGNDFDGCPNLKALHLDRNLIEYIEDDAFSKLPQLETLDLHYNYLDAIPAKALKNLTKLKKLRLSFNKIEHIDDDAFNGLKELEELNLRRNKLEDLNADNIAKNLPKLKIIILYRNNFKCPNVKKIKQTFESKKIVVEIDSKGCSK